jgi:hypothetical protein
VDQALGKELKAALDKAMDNFDAMAVERAGSLAIFDETDMQTVVNANALGEWAINRGSTVDPPGE